MRWLRGAASHVELFIAGFARVALSDDDLRAVTVRIYDEKQKGRAEPFAWEQIWWATTLPAPPARILVGGCGDGREVRTLIKWGYEVSCFDPSIDSARKCQQANPKAEFVGCFSYEDLVSRPQLLQPGPGFDAALLGWCSFSHVLSERDQARLLVLLDSLAPSGPILASILVGSQRHAVPVAEQFGSLIGRLLVRDTAASPARERVGVGAGFGFVYRFDASHLESLAVSCGRRLEVRLEAGHPHATFWPARSMPVET
jgi:SAM-dependent methyltransferase